MKFDQSKEVCYLAGYSKNGQHFYLDKRFNPILKLKDGRKMDCRKYLLIHEKTEKQHEDATGQSYQHSHELATGAERKAVEADGFPWDEYQKYCLKEAKRLTPIDSQVPSDLDLKPEHDYHDKKMERIAHQHQNPLADMVAAYRELAQKKFAKSEDLDRIRNAKYLDNLPEQPANRPEVQAKMGGLGPLAKAAPTYEGELDQKGNRAVRHRQSNRHIVWEHAPDKQHHFEQKVLHHIGNFTAGLNPEHKAIIEHVANRIQKDPTRHYVESIHPQTKLQVPKLRHLAALVSNHPSAKLRPMPDGSIVWRQERHGAEPYTYWNLTRHGIKDVTADYANQRLKKSTLEKGAMRRLAPFNPTEVPEAERGNVQQWVNDGDPYSRDDIPRMSGHARIRALHKLTGHTQTRVNPETKEREFLLHRGMSKMEDQARKAGIETGGELSSWTPDPKVALKHARLALTDPQWSTDPEAATERNPDEKPIVHSKWFPESHIHHIPNQIGDTTAGEGSHYEKPKRGIYHNEKEVIVNSNPQPMKIQKSLKPEGNPDEANEASRVRKGNKDLATPTKLQTDKGSPTRLAKSQAIQVSSVAVIHGDHVLMGRRRDSGKLTLPGGHAEDGEHPEQAAKRELFEEAGINGKELHYVGSDIVQCRDGNKREINCFVCFGYYHPTNKNDPDQEIDQWYWIPLVQFKEAGIYDSLDPLLAAELHDNPNVMLRLLGVVH